MNMGLVDTFEMWVINKITKRYLPEDGKLHILCVQVFISHGTNYVLSGAVNAADFRALETGTESEQ